MPSLPETASRLDGSGGCLLAPAAPELDGSGGGGSGGGLRRV